MPQADLTSFHSLTLSVFILVLAFFSFIYYYATPLWSAFNKSFVKKATINFFLIKFLKIEVVDFIKNQLIGSNSRRRNSSNL